MTGKANTCVEILQRAARIGVMECQLCPAYNVCPTGTAGWNNECMLYTAADLIESLSEELEQVKQERDGLNILLGQAQSMLETRTHERDAAVEDIYSMKACALCKHYPNGEQCETYFLLCCECDMGNCICKECVNGEKMQWRGIQEEV